MARQRRWQNFLALGRNRKISIDFFNLLMETLVSHPEDILLEEFPEGRIGYDLGRINSPVLGSGNNSLNDTPIVSTPCGDYSPGFKFLKINLYYSILYCQAALILPRYTLEKPGMM